MYSYLNKQYNNIPGDWNFRNIKAYKIPFQFMPRLELLSVHWSEDDFSQAACIGGLDSQKAGRRKGKEKERRLVQRVML